ncbi:hypothetical protein HDU67_010015 [Dinochytrium kinnereticum]|nr:hypothetical protein HDU67_010015 [Dinochytrium kinnereticum]
MMQIFAVHNELIDNTVPRVTSVVHYSIGISTFVYQLVGILGYLTFARTWHQNPALDRSNVIQMYPPGPLITLVQCALALLFLLSYPLQCHPARSCLDKVSGGGGVMTDVRHYAITSGLLVASFLLAVSVEDLGTVLGLVGATGSTTICYILPGILYYKLRSDVDAGEEEDLDAAFDDDYVRRRRRRRRRRLGGPSVLKYAAAGLAVFGVVVMVVCVSVQVAALGKGGGGGGGGGHLRRGGGGVERRAQKSMALKCEIFPNIPPDVPVLPNLKN